MKIGLTGITAQLLKTTELDYQGVKTKAGLLKELYAREPALANYLIQLSVNETIATKDNVSFKESDKVLIFSAFAGG